VQQDAGSNNNKSIGLTEAEDPLRGNFPARMYVREGRRINGKATFFGSDTLKRKANEPNGNLLNGGRPKLSEFAYQGVGITGYTMDTHGTSPIEDAAGKYLDTATGVGVVPLGAMMPNDIPNMFVPLAMSSSAWGYTTLRMDPVRANMGQVAALAIKFVKDNESKNITTDTLVKNTTDGKEWLVKFQTYLLEKGGKIFFYKDNEFQNPNDEQQKKAHIAAQFLGIWGVMSGYGVSKYNEDNTYLAPEKLQDIYKQGGYILGYGQNFNRAEMLISSLNGAHISFKPCLDGEKPFQDVATDQWYCKPVKTAKELGFITGYTKHIPCKVDNDKNPAFCPEENVNWAETASMVLKTIFNNPTLPMVKGEWYERITKCLGNKKNEFTKGLSVPPIDNPLKNLTRADAAIFLFNAIELRKTTDEPNNICGGN